MGVDIKSSNGNLGVGELWATWTIRCTGAVQRENGRPVRLTFEPVIRDGSWVQHDLFERPSGKENHLRKLLQQFLSLSQDSGDDEWVQAAKKLGPLFLEHPWQHQINQHDSMPSKLAESTADWLIWRERLHDFWLNLQELRNASKSLRTLAERRDAAFFRLGIDDFTLEQIPSNEIERLVEAYAPRAWETDRSDVDSRLGYTIRDVFAPPQPPILPVIHPGQLEIQMSVVKGIQALFIMSMTLARSDTQRFPRRCARRVCTHIYFMRSDQKYCTPECQSRDRQARYRSRKKAVLAAEQSEGGQTAADDKPLG